MCPLISQFSFPDLQVDFWTEPIFNSTVDICVSPLSLDHVLAKLHQAGIKYHVQIQDIQR